jgi:hypothetical protein
MRARHPFTSERDENPEELESPSAAVVVEVRLNTLTLVVEGLVVVASLVEAALIPSQLVKTRAASIVATISAVTASAVTALVALAVGCRTRRPAMSTRVGGRRACTRYQPQGAQAQRTRDRGLGRNILQIHRATTPLVL